MRKSLTILFLFLNLIVSATNYYVATPASGGNDANPGTFAQPWASWEEAFSSTSVNAGDTVFIRGGVYFATVVDGTGIRLTRSGTSGSWIVYINYPGEKPIMDFSNQTAGDILYTGNRNDGINTNGVNYVKLIGLTIRNVKQYYNRNYARGIFLRNGIITLENCTAYNCWGHGVHSEHNTDDGGNIHTVINCDSYNNCDSLSGDPLGSNAGATGAGFDAWFGITSGKTYFINCRAWGNSDQGFSIPCEGYVKCEGCWSFANKAYIMGAGGGFKMGWQNIDIPNLRREMINCVATFNTAYGFFTNEKGSGGEEVWYAVKSNHYNNIAYHNGYTITSSGFGFIIQDTKQADTIEQRRNYSNNIDYDNYRKYVYTDGGLAEYSGSNNSWDIPLTLTDADFKSLDTTGITAPRQADGSLPNNACYNNFLKLSDASQAINRGIDVGLDFEGDAPDLGPFEWTDYDAPPPLIATSYPTIVTSKRIVAGGFIIEDYDESIVWKGVCWNTTGTPTEADNIVYAGTGSDPFTVTISGLSANTTYYVRAYAITESGTGYGNIYEVTTDKWSYLYLNGKIATRNGKPQAIGLVNTTPEDNSPDYDWTDNPYFYLPPTSDNEGIPLIVGKSDTIFTYSIANLPNGSDSIWNVTYTCNIGNQVGDNFCVTPQVGDIGLHTLKIDLKVGNYIYATQTTHIKVYPKVNTGTKTLLCFGNSTMYNHFNDEMDSVKSVFDGMTLNTVGTQTNYSGEGYYHDAISGYSYHAFSGFEGSPFVKNAVINIPAYFTDYSIPTPDIVYMRLGINEINAYTLDDDMTESDLDHECNHMKSLIDAFLAYDPNLKIVIGLPNKPCLTDAQWDAAYPATAGKGSVFVKNLQRFYQRLLNGYRNPQYDARVYVCFEGIHFNRINATDVHDTSTGAFSIGRGFANTLNRLFQ